MKKRFDDFIQNVYARFQVAKANVREKVGALTLVEMIIILGISAAVIIVVLSFAGDEVKDMVSNMFTKIKNSFTTNESGVGN